MRYLAAVCTAAFVAGFLSPELLPAQESGAISITANSITANSITANSISANAITEYVAEYEVRYKGRRVARAEFSVARNAASEYVFRSSTRARGIWRLASPNPALEVSRFVVDGNAILPLAFEFQDGSRGGDDNYSIVFDRAAGTVNVAAANGVTEHAFEPGLLDRGSLQVALMRQIASCNLPDTLRYVDDAGIRAYRYERMDHRELDTGIGDLETLRISQQREGSSRETILWLVPELAYLPARIEQLRDGESETVFTLQELSGIEPGADACAGTEIR